MKEEFEDDSKTPLIKKKENNEEKSNKENPQEGNENNLENSKEKKELSTESRNNALIIWKNKLSGKVYFVFFIQSLIIFLFIYYAFHNETFKNLLQKNHKFLYVSIILASAIMIACEMVKLLMVVPFNYFFFIVFSVCISIIVCKLALLFSFKTIAILWTLLIAMILSLSFYALKAKREIRLMSTSFFVFIILLIVSLIIKFIADVPFIDMALIILCLITFNIYLIYDVNSLIEKKKPSSRDYFSLNILLYFDIIMNFIRFVNFIYKNLQSEEKSEKLDKIKGLVDDLEKGIDEVKNFGKDDNEDEDEKDDKKKKKGKKGKKEDKKEDKKAKKGKKEDKKDKKEKKGGDKKSKKEDKKKKDSGDDDKDNENNIVKDILDNIFGL